MRMSRSYLLGLGSGLILSALIAMVVPPVSINLAGDPTPTKQEMQQNTDKPQSENPGVDSNQGESSKEGQNTNPDNPENQVSVENQGSSGKSPNPSGGKETNPNPQQTEIFVIPSGSTADRIASLLLTEGWISSKEEFIDLIEERNLASRFQAGTFELTRGMSMDDILKQLVP